MANGKNPFGDTAIGPAPSNKNPFGDTPIGTDTLRLPQTTGPSVLQPGDRPEPQPLREEFQGLLEQLGGRLPSTGALPPGIRPGTIAAEKGASGKSLLRREESRRRTAFQKLQEAGHSIDEITGALAFEQAVKPPSRALRTAGTVVGGLVAGQLIPGPVDEIALATKLVRGAGKAGIAAAGGVAGEAAQIAIDPDREFNRAELAKLPGVFAEEAALEAVTLGAGAVGKRLIGGVKKGIIPGAQEMSEELAREGRRLNVKTPTRFLPAQFSENRTIDTVQGIGENSLIGSDVVFQYKKGQLKAATSLVDKLSDTVSAGSRARSSDEMASLLVDAIEQNGNAHRVAAGELYAALDESVAGTVVDLSASKKVANEMIKRAAKAGNIGTSEASQGMLNKVANQLENSVDFETAQDVRSGLLDVVRKGTSKLTPDPKAVGIAKKLTKELDTAMANAARSQGPETETLYRRANTFFKAGKDRFDNRTIRTLVKQLKDPALSKPEVAKVIFRSRENINRVRKAAGPDLFQKAKGSWVQSIVEDSLRADPSQAGGIGEPVGTTILNKFNGVGQDSLNAAFTATEQNQIRNTARTMAIVQARTGGQAGALRFVQGAALAGIVVGPVAGGEVGKEAIKGGGLLLIGPAVLGRLMTNPTFNRLLSEGFKAPRGSQQSVALTARLIRNVLDTRKEINAERSKARQRASFEQQNIAAPARQLGGFGGRGF